VPNGAAAKTLRLYPDPPTGYAESDGSILEPAAQWPVSIRRLKDRRAHLRAIADRLSADARADLLGDPFGSSLYRATFTSRRAHRVAMGLAIAMVARVREAAV
jgi:hypothetical protein